MTTDEIAQEILKLMSHSGVRHHSRVTMKDGVTFQGVPFSLQLGTGNALIVQFMADGESLPRVVRLDEIASVA